MNSFIEQAKQGATAATQRFLKTLAAVPDDKLSWSPSPTAKSALQIAAHTAASNQGLGIFIAGKPFPMGHGDEDVPATREEVVKAIEASTAAALAAFDGLSPEDVGVVIAAPWLTAPRAVFMGLVAVHLHNHAAQIDYLQTIWGDTQFHM